MLGARRLATLREDFQGLAGNEGNPDNVMQ
jgi:hypothetical protein